MSNRMPLVNSTMKREMGYIFRDYVNPIFENCLVTIIDLKTSADLQHCHIYISVMGRRSEGVIKYLKANSNKFHQILRKRLTMKFIPKLYWVSDDSLSKAQDLSKFIDRINIKNND